MRGNRLGVLNRVTVFKIGGSAGGSKRVTEIFVNLHLTAGARY